MENIHVLNRRVLVFNKSWRVIDTTTVENAFILMCRESAVGLCLNTFQTYTWEQWISQENPPKTERFVQAVEKQVPAPEAVILTEYDDMYHHTVPFSIENVYRRDQYICQYCGQAVTNDNISIDHIIPRSKGGVTDFINCVVACVKCNNYKANYLPHEVGMKLLKPPIIPVWNPLIQIKPDHRPKSWEHFVKKEW